MMTQLQDNTSKVLDINARLVDSVNLSSKSELLAAASASANADSYADVTIHVSTDDYATKYPVEKICDNFKEIAIWAKCMSQTGYESFNSITPCVDNPS